MNAAVGCAKEVIGRVMIVTMDNPPVNALAAGMREALIDAVRQGGEDDGIDAIVVIGAGRNFIAGADIGRFGSARAVSTRDSAAVIEGSGKPVVAALDGYALGGGLEHALACHYRIATPRAKLGLPEINLGLIPAGGGTARLPRLVGTEAALDLILSGRHVGADEALAMGLVDRVIDTDDLRAAAVAVAVELSGKRPLRRLGAMEPAGTSAESAAAIAAAREKTRRISKFQPAPGLAIDCIEAALTEPFDACIERERRAFAELEASDVSKALRHAFAAERKAARIAGASGAAPEPVRSAAVIGAGTMGSGIAISFANAGIPVRVLENSAEALERGLARIANDYAGRVRRGSLSQDEADRRLALIEGVTDYEDIADCDAVIEAVFERIDIKQAVFARLDAVMKPGALLLTNSSAIDIDVMAAATRRPGDVAGAHFFAPAQVMKLCETVRGEQSSMATIERAARMARDLGKVNVVVGSCDGFAANRSRAPLVSEAMILLEEGALPEQIDAVMTGFGYPMGPFAVSDLSGLDVSYDTRKRRAAQYPDFRKLPVPDRMVEMGRHGQKNGKGWYRYAEGSRTPIPDPEAHAIIAGVVRELGNTPRSFSDEDILQRLLFASINEACRILEEGKAARATDIDVMWLNGFGFPRHRGGLMFWGDTVGAEVIHARVSEWAGTHGKRWSPARLLAETAARRGRLCDIEGSI